MEGVGGMEVGIAEDGTQRIDLHRLLISQAPQVFGGQLKGWYFVASIRVFQNAPKDHGLSMGLSVWDQSLTNTVEKDRLFGIGLDNYLGGLPHNARILYSTPQKSTVHGRTSGEYVSMHETNDASI